MRVLEFKTIKKIFNTYPSHRNIAIFVETGTYKGGTIIPMSKYFKELHTIDICENAINFSKQLAQKGNIKNIRFYLGDSAVKLQEIIQNIDINQPVIFFLDGHVTDNRSGFTGKGQYDVPLLEELKQINTLRNQNDIIIIDDFRIFGKKPSKETANADWTNINIKNLLEIFPREKILTYFVDPQYNKKTKENDRFIILLKRVE